MLLGLFGMWLRRLHRREDSLIYPLFTQFLVVTEIGFGRTSGRVFLDAYLIVFGAGAVATKFMNVSSQKRAAPDRD